MTKHAFYFPHDSNASTQDPKILMMRSVYKSEGLGWYWLLIEQLRDQEDYKLSIFTKYGFDALALRLDADIDRLHSFINDCVEEFKLFEKDDQYIWSPDLIKKMQPFDDRSEKASRSAQKRWPKQPQNKHDQFDGNANAVPTQCAGNAKRLKENKVKDSKLNETKENIIIPEYLKMDVWEAFLETRRRKKAPSTDHALKLILAELEKLREAGDDPNEVLDQSIMRGYSGVFALKNPGSSSLRVYTSPRDLQGLPGNAPSGAFSDLPQ
jgi:hypothetical protein